MGDLTFQVSEAITVINQVHEQAFPFILIEGEVASFKINQNKFVFFDIKDSEGSLGCFMMVFQLKLPLQDGMKVKIVAQPKLTKWGKFSLTVREVTPIGEGSLKKSFELLKSSLQAEGLFDQSRKRTIPVIPQRIAVISSSKAAGYTDFIKILENRWAGLDIVLYDIAVQGKKASTDILGALCAVNGAERLYDVVAIVRGGGSADDLSVFSHEDVVRAVASSRTPTVVGVGHEVDISLCDLAADIRAVTPSNAAEILVPTKTEVLSRVRQWAEAIATLQEQCLVTPSERSAMMVGDMYIKALQLIKIKHSTIKSLRRGLAQLDPCKVLQRGYAVVRADTVALSSVAHATIGAAITIEFTDGIVGAEITHVK